MIELDDIRAAAATLGSRVHRTPVLTSRTLDSATGATVLCKAENLQRGGSFKVRGALNRLSAIDEDARPAGVVAGSSGNHAQGVALAAQTLEIPATIVMPTDAPAVKRAATRGYGADIVDFDRRTQSRDEVVDRVRDQRGGVVVPAYDDEYVMAGQGTVALELLDQAPDLDLLVAPLGGGGLMSGCAVATKALSPTTRIIGVEPVGADDWAQSIRSGTITRIPPPSTIADGVRSQEPGRLTFPVVSPLIDEVVLVDDTQILTAMRFVLQRMKVVLEPTGAVALAAVLSGAVPVRGLRVGVVFSGGNADPAVITRALEA